MNVMFLKKHILISHGVLKEKGMSLKVSFLHPQFQLFLNLKWWLEFLFTSFKINLFSKVYSILIRFKEIYSYKMKNQEMNSYYLIGLCKLSCIKVNYWILMKNFQGVFSFPNIHHNILQLKTFFHYRKASCTYIQKIISKFGIKYKDETCWRMIEANYS